VLNAVASMQPEAIAAQIETQMRQAPPGLSTCACGEGAAMVAVSAATALGAVHGTVVSYAHSGDTVFGEDDRVVGYGSVACTEAGSATPAAGLSASGLAAQAEPPAGLPAQAAGGPGPAAPAGPGPEELDQADRDYLLRLARGTLAQFLQTGTVPLPRSSSPALQRPRGVFVTLNEHGRLRGCIGHMAEDTPLQLATARMALEAALRDPRFRPVGADELSQIEVEISVLTPFVRVTGPERFVVGRDGVVLDKSGHRAVYLPQVAPEQGWTRAETLAHLCEKAGLAADCWQEGATLSTFQAQVFAEASSR
jgi:AmmeMemoRadiSam system protein A